MAVSRRLIVNADDFGASSGVNRGIVEAHTDGIVTSTSLMVTGRVATDAVALARAHPQLALGLHWDLDGERGVAVVDLDDPVAVRAELGRQLELFETLVGARPTHVDSHHHVHRGSEILTIARELVAPLGVPLRGDEPVSYVGGFYGQWEWQRTDLEHVRPEFLIWILNNEVGPGWTEIGCHPGYVTADFESSYLREREVELRTLTDATVRAEIESLGIRLCSYADLIGTERE